VTEKATSGRRKVARVGIAGGLIAALAILVPWKKCGGELGVPGFKGSEGPSIDDTPRPVATGPTGDPPASPLAQPPRCQVRLDATGLTLAGSPAERAAVIAACKEMGAADVVVTGDAAQGQWDALRGALDKAGVKSYVRGAPETAAIDAGTKAPSTRTRRAANAARAARRSALPDEPTGRSSIAQVANARGSL
jgi:hypothetical protein